MRPRILVIDDEEAVLEVVREILGDDYEVHAATSGRRALALLERFEYDVIVSDLLMPDLDGKDLYHLIRARFPHLADRVLFFTGDTANPATLRFLDHCPVRTITKPFPIRVLTDEVREHCRARTVDCMLATRPFQPSS